MIFPHFLTIVDWCEWLARWAYPVHINLGQVGSVKEVNVPAHAKAEHVGTERLGVHQFSDDTAGLVGVTAINNDVANLVVLHKVEQVAHTTGVLCDL
jgi:hypothetical protein